MKRLKIAIIFGNKPNFDKFALKYFILSLNKIQTYYEFTFPDLEIYPFKEKLDCEFKTSKLTFENFAIENNIISDHLICIITNKFSNNYFFNANVNSSIITTVFWDKYFSPPSLFEFLLHSISCCLIYSQKTKPNELTENAKNVNISYHRDTRGCVADFTRIKKDDRIDITLGYICDEHKSEIIEVFGEKYLAEMTIILERKWIGNIEERNSVAYNLKHIFKFDINKDSGFNKSWFEKFKDKVYDTPGELVKDGIKLILTVIITYILVKIGK